MIGASGARFPAYLSGRSTPTKHRSIPRCISVTLSVDHRVLDGALGARLLNAIARNIENPLATIA
jgi:pyruvate/2-oxoglutarate dehydrogenase complex dihydrolipoamide acyltransferase (E2) component